MKLEFTIDESVESVGAARVDHAEINLSIPITCCHGTPRCSREPDLLDAVYVPSLGLRPEFVNMLPVLLGHARQVHILLSDDVPCWLNTSTDGRVIVHGSYCSNEYARFMSLRSSDNPSSQHRTDYDLPFKRNVALSLARQSGHRYIGLVDDDITMTMEALRTARALLFEHGRDMVGFHVLDYPDVSTIDHVQRFVTQVPSRVSIGGNCLFLDTTTVDGFFPYVYNEDWLFIFMNMLGKKSVSSGGFVRQMPHAPWLDHERIRFEQFGEFIIEGFKETIGEHRLRTDLDFWSRVHGEYLSRLLSLIDQSSDPVWTAALECAVATHRTVSPDDAVVFLESFIKERGSYFAYV